MTLWCANAVANNAGYADVEYVGVVCAAETAEEAWELLKVLHPDKHIVWLVNWCPIWLIDYWRVWQRWHHLRGHASLLLHPFTDQPFPVYDTHVLVNVKAFLAQYNPFGLARWIWGEDVALNVLRRLTAMGHVICSGLGSSHSDRIALLVLHPATDPVQVVEYFVHDGVRNNRWIIGDGTHRFAAAVVRGVDEIAAVTTREWAERLIKDGLAKAT